MPVANSHSLREKIQRPNLKPLRFTSVLVAELILIVVFPFTAGLGLGAHVFRLLGVLLFCVALYTVLGRGRTSKIAIVLGSPPIALAIANTLVPMKYVQEAALGLGGLFLLFITGMFIRAVLMEASVTTDTLSGAVSAYLLTGIAMGLIYGCIELLSPGSFRETFASEKVISPPDLVFFSFTTLTTVGYGDIVPWHGPVKSLAIIEAVVGIMYPAVLIARLIGLHSGQRRSE